MQIDETKLVTEGSEVCPVVLTTALDLTKRPPIYITAQAYRDRPFDEGESGRLRDHLDSWRAVLAGCGVMYDGILSNGKCDPEGRLLYSIAITIDQAAYPAALALVIDALFELTCVVPSAEWEIHAVEQVVTRLRPSGKDRQLVAGERLFGQLVRGQPADDEHASPLPAFT